MEMKTSTIPENIRETIDLIASILKRLKVAKQKKAQEN